MGKWLILMVVVLGLSMDLLDMTIVNVALPDMMNQLGTDLHMVQYVVTAYMMTIGLVEPVVAYLADTRGMKKIYLVSLAVFILGSVLSAQAWNVETLIVFRVFQAVGGGMIMPISLAIVQKTFEPRELPLAMGLMGIPLLVAPAIGPVVGGYLVEHFDWRWIFWINVPLGVPALVLSWMILREFDTVRKSLDIPGFVLSALGFSTLLLAISNGPDQGWGSVQIVGLFFISISSLALFVWVEVGHREPLLDLRLFGQRVYTSASVVTFFFMLSLFGSLYLVPLFLQQLQGMGPVDTGLVLIPEVVSAALFIPVSALLLPRVGASVLTMVGALIMSGGMLSLTGLEMNSELGILKQHLAIIGCGLGLGIMPAVTLAYGSLPDHLVNQGSAFLNLVRQIGSALGVALLTTILQERQPVYLQRYADAIVLGSPAAEAWQQVAQTIQAWGHSAGEAQEMMKVYLVQTVTQGSMVMAFHDAFFLAALFGAVTVIPALFLYRGRGSRSTSIPRLGKGEGQGSTSGSS